MTHGHIGRDLEPRTIEMIRGKRNGPDDIHLEKSTMTGTYAGRDLNPSTQELSLAPQQTPAMELMC